MAHPSREKYIPYLQEKLGDVPVAMDEHNNIWETCRRAWLLHEPNADYHFVIQDDAIIGKDFHKNIQKLVENGNDYVYNLYVGRPKFKMEVLKLKQKGGNHFVKANIHHEIALGFPTRRIKEMVDFVDAQNAGQEVQHDRHINRYVTSNKLKVFFPLPSLIEHRAEPSLHNLNKGGYKPVAIWFIGQ